MDGEAGRAVGAQAQASNPSVWEKITQQGENSMTWCMNKSWMSWAARTWTAAWPTCSWTASCTATGRGCGSCAHTSGAGTFLCCNFLSSQFTVLSQSLASPLFVKLRSFSALHVCLISTLGPGCCRCQDGGAGACFAAFAGLLGNYALQKAALLHVLIGHIDCNLFPDMALVVRCARWAMALTRRCWCWARC